MKGLAQTYFGFWFHPQAAPVSTAPEPRPQRAPVFIHDAVIPWRGETMLLSILRQQALDHQDQP